MPSADTNYVQTIEDLKLLNQQMVDELVDGKWESLHPLFGLQSLEERPPHLSREELETRFLELHENQELSAVEHRSLAQQSDFLAALEKAFTLRGRTRLQTICQGGSRSWGAVHAEGLLNQGMSRLPTLEAP